MSKKQGWIFLFGGATGGLLFAILGFSMGWIVTSGHASATVAEMSAEAVKDQLVPICVYQFDGQADRDGQLKKLLSLGKWEREGFVTEHGWATMPGSDSPASGVARACAERLSQASS